MWISEFSNVARFLAIFLDFLSILNQPHGRPGSTEPQFPGTRTLRQRTARNNASQAVLLSTMTSNEFGIAPLRRLFSPRITPNLYAESQPCRPRLISQQIRNSFTTQEPPTSSAGPLAARIECLNWRPAEFDGFPSGRSGRSLRMAFRMAGGTRAS